MKNETTNVTKANEVLLSVADQYQHLTYGDLVVPVPYFINTAEQIYKQTMREVGIEIETVNKVIKYIKEGKTPLGSTGGKGSPKELSADLARLMAYLDGIGYHPTSKVHMRSWMTEMHIGLDCAGYIYQILAEIEKTLNTPILSKLAWRNKEDMKPSHAGAFIFDSENLEKITDFRQLKPLDILVFSDHTHVGMICDYKHRLALTDCSMGKNGISFFYLDWVDGDLIAKNSDSWTTVLKNKEVVVRRLAV